MQSENDRPVQQDMWVQVPRAVEWLGKSNWENLGITLSCGFEPRPNRYASVAQLVEHLVEAQGVEGSSPS